MGFKRFFSFKKNKLILVISLSNIKNNIPESVLSMTEKLLTDHLNYVRLADGPI